MKSKEFTLNLNAAHELRSKLGKINLLFPDVTIKFEDSSTKHRTKIEWITLEAQTDDIISNAKNYITSFTNPASTVSVESPPGFNNKLLRNNESLLCALQRSCCAYIAIKSDTHVCIQGIDDTTVALARSLIDNEIEVFKNNPEIKEDKAIEINSHVHNFCLKLGYTDGEMQVAAHECNKNNMPINENTLLLELMKRNPHKVKKNAMKRSVERITKSVGEMTTNETTNELRDIVIDGSNVAMGHGNKQIFSCRGIQIAVDWFRTRGHKNIFVFVPQFRLEASTPTRPICDQNILKELEQEKVIVFTPSRKVNGRRVVSYDDRIFVKYAYENDCIIVSNDNFRDLAKENGDWQTFIEHHLLMYSFVHDCFMPPDDPLGKYGPTLDEYLKKQTSYNKQPCPFKNKCTYGAKCKYYHANQSPQPAIPKQSIMQPVLARGAADPPTMKLSLAPEQPPKMQQQIRKRETNIPTTNYNGNTQRYQQHYNQQQQQQYMRSQQQPYGQSMQFQNVQAYYNIQGNQQPSFYQPQQQTNMAYMERYPPQHQQMAYYNNDPRQQYADQSGGYYPPIQQQATKSNYERLLELFPGQTKSIHNAIRMNPTEANLDMLISKVVAQLP